MQQLPGKVKAGYGAAELGAMGAEILVRVYLLKFYTDTVGLRPDLAGYAVALGVLWDAVTDPLMGVISDRSKWRWGRRIPFMLVGAFVLPLALYLLFHPPELDDQMARFLYLVATYMFFNTALTILAVPHAAFAGDMTNDGDQRMQLFGYRLFAGNLGLVTGTVLPGLFAAMATGGVPESETSWVMGLVIVVTSLMCVLTTRRFDKPARTVASKGVGIRPRVRYMANKAFLILFTAYFIATVGLTINSSLALYYYTYRLLLDDATVNGIIAFFVVIFCLSIPMWVLIARRTGKKKALVCGVTGLALMTIVSYPLFPPGNANWPYLAALLGGLFVGAVVLLDAALADIVDYDRVWSRQARNNRSHQQKYPNPWPKRQR